MNSGLFVCQFGCVTQKTISPIYLIFYAISIIPVARSSSKMVRIVHHCEIGQNMRSK